MGSSNGKHSPALGRQVMEDALSKAEAVAKSSPDSLVKGLQEAVAAAASEAFDAAVLDTPAFRPHSEGKDEVPQGIAIIFDSDVRKRSRLMPVERFVSYVSYFETSNLHSTDPYLRFASYGASVEQVGKEADAVILQIGGEDNNRFFYDGTLGGTVACIRCGSNGTTIPKEVVDRQTGNKKRIALTPLVFNRGVNRRRCPLCHRDSMDRPQGHRQPLLDSIVGRQFSYPVVNRNTTTWVDVSAEAKQYEPKQPETSRKIRLWQFATKIVKTTRTVVEKLMSPQELVDMLSAKLQVPRNSYEAQLCDKLKYALRERGGFHNRRLPNRLYVTIYATARPGFIAAEWNKLLEAYDAGKFVPNSAVTPIAGKVEEVKVAGDVLTIKLNTALLVYPALAFESLVSTGSEVKEGDPVVKLIQVDRNSIGNGVTVEAWKCIERSIQLGICLFENDDLPLSYRPVAEGRPVWDRRYLGDLGLAYFPWRMVPQSLRDKWYIDCTYVPLDLSMRWKVDLEKAEGLMRRSFNSEELKTTEVNPPLDPVTETYDPARVDVSLNLYDAPGRRLVELLETAEIKRRTNRTYERALGMLTPPKKAVAPQAPKPAAEVPVAEATKPQPVVEPAPVEVPPAEATVAQVAAAAPADVVLAGTSTDVVVTPPAVDELPVTGS